MDAASVSPHVAHITKPAPGVDRGRRWQSLGYTGATIWFTGLPASGKSTIAAAVESRLVLAGRSAYRLDGDLLRTGLNRDLGFDWESRTENVRRTAEVARTRLPGRRQASAAGAGCDPRRRPAPSVRRA